MIKEIYKEIRNYLMLFVKDIAIKYQSPFIKSNEKYVVVKNNKAKKSSLEKSNYQLIKRKEGKK